MMNNVNYYTEAPLNYLTCFKTDCPKASTCLRQLVAMQTPQKHIIMSVINPAYLNEQTKACDYYRPLTKVKFAKGFMKFFEELPLKQGRLFASQMIAHYNRRDYFYMRKGELLLSPSRQHKVQQILNQCGVTLPLAFDDYVEKMDW